MFKTTLALALGAISTEAVSLKISTETMAMDWSSYGCTSLEEIPCEMEMPFCVQQFAQGDDGQWGLQAMWKDANKDLTGGDG